MKKLITLLILFVGMVSTASATEYTVYFKPGSTWAKDGAAFQLNMKKSDSEWKKVNFTLVAGTSDIYRATFDTYYSGGFQFLRMKGDYSAQWNYSGMFSALTSDYYVDKSANNWNDTWVYNTENITTKTPSNYTSTYTIIAEGNGDILPNFMDANSEVGNALSSNSDFTYSRTVTGNVVRAGSYGFKISDGTTTYDNGGSAWPVTASENGIYNIVYTFNCVTGVASATATKTADAAIEEKYLIAGSEELLGYDWDTSGDHNVLIVEDGVGTLSFDDVTLAAHNNGFKAVKVWRCGGTKYKTVWENVNDNHVCDIKRNSIYDVTFTCNIANFEAGSSAASVEASELAGYFLFGGTSDWVLGQRMTESAGVYSATISNDPGYAFVIVSTEYLNSSNGVTDWKKVIRPNSTENQRYMIPFVNDNGTTMQDEDDAKALRAWKIQDDTGYNDANDGDVTITFNPSGTWTVTCSDEVEISGAGYATYSNKYQYKVSGAEKLYTVSGINGTGTKVVFADHDAETVFNAGSAILIKGSSTVTINAVAKGTSDTPLGYNYLVGSLNGTEDITAGKGIFIFNWDGSTPSTVGFYKASSGTLNAHKAYLNISALLPGDAREFLAFGDDETTGVEAVKASQKMNGEFFNLAGQRVAQPTKGLYIVNGKKVIMK